MAYTIGERLKNAWSEFMNRDPPAQAWQYSYGGSSYRPDRARFGRTNAKSLVVSRYTKIAMDCAQIQLEHVKVDENGNYVETIDSELNRCLTLNANKDQTSRAFIQDAVMSMFDEGCVALPPIEFVERRIVGADGQPVVQRDILSMRTAKILKWFPDHIKIQAYNDIKGEQGELTVEKAKVPILENPLYAIMNEPNSTVQRIIRTINMSDTLDSQNSSGKLDMIIQLPYAVKSPARQAMANDRKKQVEEQLTNSKYGIAYLDSTEKIVQLNRAVENNLYDRVDKLMHDFDAQLGITEEIMNGTADSKTMQNYYSRTIEPIVAVIIDNMRWKYLSDEQRKRGETIMMFRNPFRIMPVEEVANAADKFTRNEIMTPNEWRPIVGLKPVKAEEANELRNRNISAAKESKFANTEEDESGGEDNTK